MRQEEIRELEKALKAKENLLIPKKKFGFKSKPQSPAEATQIPHKEPKIDEFLSPGKDLNLPLVKQKFSLLLLLLCCNTSIYLG